MSIKIAIPMFLFLANAAFAQTADLAYHASGLHVSAAAGTPDAGLTFNRFVEEVLNRKNTAAATDYFAPLFRHHSLPEELQPVPVEAYASWQKTFNKAFPDARWTIDYVSVKDDVISYHLTMHATHQGNYAGVAATGRAVTTTETGIMRLENGKIVECWATFDDYRLIQAIR
jgi:predicted ester cyclase